LWKDRSPARNHDENGAGYEPIVAMNCFVRLKPNKG